MKKFFENISNFIKLTKKISKLKKKVIFFSEGTHHLEHLKPFINFFLNRTDIIFISLSNKDKAKKIVEKNFHFYELNSYYFLNLFFKTIDNAYIFTSLPDLGQLYFKKHNNNKFLYIFHSLASAHIQYNRLAFKYFDTIFCAGQHHYNELSMMKKKYNLHYNKLIKYGYPKIEKISENVDKTSSKSILIASSWGENSITNTVSLELIDILLKKLDYKIIFRPHNMSLKIDKKRINTIKNSFKNSHKFHIDDSNSSYNSLIDSKVLITDWGSTSADFFLGLNKPVIFIDTKMKKKNNNYFEISELAFEIDSRKDMGIIINSNKIREIDNKLIESLYVRKNDNVRENLIKKYIYNFKNSEIILEKELKNMNF